MSKDFEYDPETGSFRFDEGDGKTKKKNDVDVGGWILIAALFAFGLWPIGLIALISKLSDKPKKVNSSRGGTRTSTSPNANVSSHSKVEKSVVKTAKQMNRAPKTSDKTARTLMIIGGIIAVFALCIRKELLLPLLCGIFLVESLSVMLQVSYFKYTKRKYGEGRRILLMSPLHHHYQKQGFFETKIVTRFWIVSLLLAAITLVTLKIR